MIASDADSKEAGAPDDGSLSRRHSRRKQKLSHEAVESRSNGPSVEVGNDLAGRRPNDVSFEGPKLNKGIVGGFIRIEIKTPEGRTYRMNEDVPDPEGLRLYVFGK